MTITFDQDMDIEEVAAALDTLANHYEGGDVQVRMSGEVIVYTFSDPDGGTAVSKLHEPFSFQWLPYPKAPKGPDGKPLYLEPDAYWPSPSQ